MEQKEAMAISMGNFHRKLFFEPLGTIGFSHCLVFLTVAVALRLSFKHENKTKQKKNFGLGEEAKKKGRKKQNAERKKKLFFWNRQTTQA